MQNTRKRIITRAAQIGLFIGLFVLAEWLIALLLCREPSAWGRRILNQVYSDEHIDTCFVGGSQVLQGIDPSIVSERIGSTAVNITSSQQPPAATAALVREVLKEHPEISRVYVSLDYSLLMAEDVNLESIYIVSDAMKLSWNKVRYLLRATPQEYYVNSFLPLRKGEQYASSLSEIKENIRTLCSEDYRNRIAASGFVAKDGMRADEFLTLKEEVLGDDSYHALADESGHVILPKRSRQAIEDILDACRVNGVELVFFATPMPDFMTEAVPDYDRYAEMLERLLSQEGAAYYDYNTLVSDASAESVRRFDRSEAGNFADEWHLSGEGAQRFTELLMEETVGTQVY